MAEEKKALKDIAKLGWEVFQADEPYHVPSPYKDKYYPGNQRASGTDVPGKYAAHKRQGEFLRTETASDPDTLLQRGRALRRRRQLAPVVAVVAIAAVGYGILAFGGGDGARTDDLPPVAPPSTAAPRWLEQDRPVAPGVYDLALRDVNREIVLPAIELQSV